MKRLFLKSPQIGLALSGGSVRGFAHLGVLKVIEEYKIPINMIAGTSIGAIIGALYASGCSVKELISITSRIRWNHLFQFSKSSAGISSGEPIQRLIKRIITHDSFQSLRIPFSAIVTDISKGESVAIKEGSISEAIRMSASFPGVYSPVNQKGSLMMDGALFANLPVDEVKAMGADIVIGVDVLPRAKMNQKPHNLFEVMDRSIDLVLKNQTTRRHCDLLLEPVTEWMSSMDIGRKKDLIDMGEKAAREKLIPFLKHYLAI